MNKTLDDFSKNLAGGMSRRKAFLKFLGGAGALGFLGSREAKAQYTNLKDRCVVPCLEQASAAYLECLEEERGFEICWTQVMAPAYSSCVQACEAKVYTF